MPPSKNFLAQILGINEFQKRSPKEGLSRRSFFGRPYNDAQNGIFDTTWPDRFDWGSHAPNNETTQSQHN